MRFQNWDVLLFPALETTPIQEFKTECCVMSDPDQAFLSSINLDVKSNPPESRVDAEVKHLHTVQSYICMLQPGAPFLISIYSWKKPEITAGDFQAMIEARVFIDGSPTTYVVSSIDGGWPIIIDTFPVNSPSGPKKQTLNFPPFRPEYIQRWANNNNDVGNIKIIISEGVGTPNGVSNREISYMRLNNIVTFQYRYAPQEFLESVGIYYPSSRRYDNSLARWFPMTIPEVHLGSPCPSFGSPVRQHSHSPSRKPVTDGPPPPPFDLFGKSAPGLQALLSACPCTCTAEHEPEDTNMPDYPSRKGTEVPSPMSPDGGGLPFSHFIRDVKETIATSTSDERFEMQATKSADISTENDHPLGQEEPFQIYIDKRGKGKANTRSRKASGATVLDDNVHRKLREFVREASSTDEVEINLESNPTSRKGIVPITPRKRSDSHPLEALQNIQ